MPPTVAIYDASIDLIGERLKALELDIQIVPFDKNGIFYLENKAVRAEEMEVDYLWLSPQINEINKTGAIFDVVLSCKSLGVLQTFNAGLDHPFYAKLAEKGVRILNSSAQGVAIAEYVIGQVLAVLQPIEMQRRLQIERDWRVTPFREISQTHWLIMGFGPIGSAVAKRAKAFGAEISTIRRSNQLSENVDRVGTLTDATAFAVDADIIVLACPLNEATRGVAGERFFQAAKPGSILINVARAGLIDDRAMIAALDDGRLETAILDVFHREPLPMTDPLWVHPKVRITSHTSFAGDGVYNRWDELFLNNIQRFAQGNPLLQEVDPNDII